MNRPGLVFFPEAGTIYFSSSASTRGVSEPSVYRADIRTGTCQDISSINSAPGGIVDQIELDPFDLQLGRSGSELWAN